MGATERKIVLEIDYFNDLERLRDRRERVSEVQACQSVRFVV